MNICIRTNLFVPKLSKKRRQTKVFVPQHRRNEETLMHLSINYQRGGRKTNLFVPKLSKEQSQKTKVFVPQPLKEQEKLTHSSLNYQRDEQKRIYLFLNYRRNKDAPKHLFLNYRRNEENRKYSFLNYRWFDIASVALKETFRFLELCSTCWRKVNPQLTISKHINTLRGISTISKPYWTVFYRIKWALQDVSELGYLVLTRSSLHIIAWDLDVQIRL